LRAGRLRELQQHRLFGISVGYDILIFQHLARF
jgi:hypothetical protein